MPGLPRTIVGVLRGDPAVVGDPLGTRVLRALIALATIASHLVGAGVVIVLVLLVLPLPDEVDGDTAVTVRNLVAAGAYLALVIPLGLLRGLLLARPVMRLLASDQRAGDAERRMVLRLPLRLVLGQALSWAAAVVLFVALNVFTSGLFAFEVGITVALGGIATASFSYLLTIRLARSAAARVLAEAPPRRREAPGVGTRLLSTWTATSAVPVAGALLVSIFALTLDIGAGALARATLVLSGVGLLAGVLGMLLLARSLGDPLKRLRDGLAAVEGGDLDVELPIYDATEIGYATAGLNRLVGGLRERERLRDLFGRQVGEDVARRALEQGVTLGGEQREAAALFVDLVGSTAFAAGRAPDEVVEALNAFFAVVVETTGAHGGLVNKFAGDAALCVFGAPLDQADPAGCALAAAREMQRRLHAELDGLEAGIGVSAGTVVAGNVGTHDRYEYTVIGDAVNEAARLTELAKERPGRVLASQAAVEAAGAEEAARWCLGDEVHLRGRDAPTRLAEPVGG